MLNHVPFIHLIELYKDKYFYDTNTNAVLHIPHEVFQFLNKILHTHNITEEEIEKEYNNLSSESRMDVDYLLSEGYLLDRNKSVRLEHPETDRLESFYKTNLNTITLQVTQNCNLRCKYCIYSGSYINRTHTNKRMSIETAIRAIDFLHEHSMESNEISIGFYGGEPLLELELVKKCVSHAEKLFRGKKLRFNMTSNATLLNENIIRFLSEHGFDFTISLDGPNEIQNTNRIFAGNNKGTFDVVMRNIELVRKICPEYIKKIFFNAVIDLKQDVSCTNQFFMSYDLVKDIGVSGNFVDNNNLKEKDDGISPEFYANSNYEAFKVYLSSCTDLLEKYDSSLYGFQLSYLNNLLGGRSIISSHEKCVDCPGGQCVPGIQRLFVNVDGSLFPCERVNEDADILCLGDINSGFDIKKSKRVLNVSQITEQECKKCWCNKLCEQCCQKAEEDGEFSKKRRLSFCSATRAMAEHSIKNYIVLKKYKSTSLK